MKNLKYWFTGLCALVAAGTFVACEDDAPVSDEWTANYVYLERVTLGVDGSTFTLGHSTAGVSGGENISMPVVVRLHKPCSEDVLVKLSLTTSGFPEGTVAFENSADGLLVIPAGEISASENLTVTTDWSWIDKPKASYTAVVGLESVDSRKVELSTKQSSLTLTVNKPEKDIIENYVRLDDITQYYTLYHTLKGVFGGESISLPVRVSLYSASVTKVDLTVELSCELEGIPEEAIEFVDGKTLTIPSGQTELNTTVNVKTDWSWVTDPAATYDIKIRIASVTEEEGLYIWEDFNVEHIVITKNEKLNVANGVYLDGEPVTHSVIHTEAGIDETEFSMPVDVKMIIASEQATTVKLGYTVEGLDENAVSFQNGGELTIPAGSTEVSETVLATIDWTDASTTAENYAVKVFVESVTGEDGLEILTTQNERVMTVTKCPLLTVSTAWLQPEIKAQPGWSASYNYGENLWNTASTDFSGWNASRIIDGNWNNYIYLGTPYISFKVDFGEVTEFKALGVYNAFAGWGMYPISKVKVLISEDGSTWEMVTPKDGLDMAGDVQVQYLKWESSLRARYTIWHVYSTGAPVVSEFLLSTEANNP